MSAGLKIDFARMPLLILLAAEGLVLFSSIYVATSLRIGADAMVASVPGPQAPRAIAVTLVILLSLYSMGLYHFHQRVYFHEVFVRVVVALALGTLGLMSIYYFVPSLRISPAIGAISVFYSLTLLLLARLIFMRQADDSMFRRKILIYGAGERAGAIADLKRSADRRGFQIVGRVPAPGDTVGEKVQTLASNDQPLLDLAIETGADEIVVAMDDRRGNLPERQLLDCKLRGIEVVDLLEFLERETGKIHTDVVHRGWLIFSPGFRIGRWRRYSKRVFDLIVSLLILTVMWPVLFLVALAIKWEDGLRAPVFYRQYRIGLHGDPIRVIKFRSMRVDAEAESEPVWTAKHDDRITRLGRLLRKFRIDEFPQLFNVLMGQMSLVGPRPERPLLVDELSKRIAFYPERHTVKPGITGWAQVRYPYAASEADVIQKLQYDLFYVKNHGLLFDITIILQTVEVIFWSKGAR